MRRRVSEQTNDQNKWVGKYYCSSNSKWDTENSCYTCVMLERNIPKMILFTHTSKKWTLSMQEYAQSKIKLVIEFHWKWENERTVFQLSMCALDEK